MTGVDRFVAERQPDWAELDGLVRRARGRPGRSGGDGPLGAHDVLRLGALYRAAAADLAAARRRFPRDPLVGRLEPVVREARHLVYAHVSRRRSALDWLHTGYWRRVREQPRALAAAAVLLWVPLIGVAVWAHGDPVAAARVSTVSPVTDGATEPADDADRNFSTGQSAAFSSQIFTNNMRVALLCFAAGITAGIGTAAVLLYNGLSIGLLAGLIIASGRGDVFFRLVVPHGLLELSLITVAGAAGLRLGWALVHPGHRGRGEALAAEARAAAELALGCALWLIPCGVVEGFVTPQGLPLPAAITVGAGLAAVYWGLVAWRGRAPGTEPAP